MLSPPERNPLIEFSPTGKRVVHNSGPLDAEIVCIGESPAAEELKEGVPFVGKAGKMLNAGFRYVGIDRSRVRLVNLVPVRAPNDKFALHDSRDIDWGRERLQSELRSLNQAKVIIALGANPLEWLFGTRPPVSTYGDDAGGSKGGFIGQWRGSVIPASVVGTAPEDYLALLNTPNRMLVQAAIVPTYHPAAILRQYNWHPYFLMDLKKAADVARVGVTPTKYRDWYWQSPSALADLASSAIDQISYDTEMESPIVGISTFDEVHVFEYNEQFHDALESLLTNERIWKIAHNWLHDYAWSRVKFGIVPKHNLIDTQGFAHILNTALQKELSPHIATRYTNWAYHKWLRDVDPMLYCGMDSVVCFDAYEPQITQLYQRKLDGIAEHDHRLLAPLMEMQAVGFKIDEVARKEVETELSLDLAKADTELTAMVQPIIDTNLTKFEKPHLFLVDRKCACCGGGKLQRSHCVSCLGMTKEPENRVEWGEALCRIAPPGYVGRKWTIKQIRELVPSCKTCNGVGKVPKRLPFNSDSPDQLADVIYRGLKIRPRKYKGKETIKAAQLDPIKDRSPVIGKIIETSKVRAEYDTVARLTAGGDGLLHCCFDPFGTGSGRVAGKEGLVEVGTNPMNLPKKARRFVVPRKGKVFLYPDMEQIEARVVAVLSKDKALAEAFTIPIDWPGNPRHGTIDSHTRVMQLMSPHIEIDRDQSKRYTYAAIYGGQAKQLAQELNAEAFRRDNPKVLTVGQVQLGLDVFFTVFHGVKKWQEDILDEVFRTRKLRNPLTGREFTWLGYLTSTNRKTKQQELKHEIKKQVWSRLPQDTAAYILALGLVDIYNSDAYGDLLQPLIHVHDALLMEAPIDRVEEAEKVAISHLSRYIWGMSFPSKMKIGSNWAECS